MTHRQIFGLIFLWVILLGMFCGLGYMLYDMHKMVSQHDAMADIKKEEIQANLSRSSDPYVVATIPWADHNLGFTFRPEDKVEVLEVLWIRWENTNRFRATCVIDAGGKDRIRAVVNVYYFVVEDKRYLEKVELLNFDKTK